MRRSKQRHYYDNIAVSKRIVSEQHLKQALVVQRDAPLVLVSRVVPLVTSLETSTRRLVLVSRVVTSRNKKVIKCYYW